MKEKIIKCCFCKKIVSEIYSNNANPVKNGRCCNNCNLSIVIPARFNLTNRGNRK